MQESYRVVYEVPEREVFVIEGLEVVQEVERELAARVSWYQEKCRVFGVCL